MNLAGCGACALTGLLWTATNLSIKHLREDYSEPISKYAEKSKEFECGAWFDIVKDIKAWTWLE